MISHEDVEQLLAVGNESQSFEVKGPGSLKEKPFVAKVARAVMAMGNRRDGGVVCVGVDEPQMKDMQPGLDDDQASEWADFDNVAAALAKYSDPAVVFELAGYALSSGANVVVLDVAEFDVVPHVCKKTFPDVLQDGMAYVRPRGKPESVPVPNSAEMRALLDLATAKGVREWVRVGTLAGVPLTETKSQEQLDDEEYTKERTTAWTEPSPVVAGLLEIGYFDVAVRPTTYSSGRILPVDLESFVTDNTVRLRGWPLPFVDYRAPRFRKETMVGQDLEASGVPHHEAWRMWGSGQFLQRRALASDLRDHSDLLPADPSATGAVAVWDVLLYLVEVAEFGARMSTSLEEPSITFDVGVCGVSGRELISGDHRRELYGPYISPFDTLETHQSVASARLLTEPRQVGVELAQDVLKQFGLNVPDQVLFDYQAQVLDPS